MQGTLCIASEASNSILIAFVGVLVMCLKLIVRRGHYLDDVRIREDDIELVHQMPESERVDDEVFVTCGYLHEACEPQVTSVRVVLELQVNLTSTI